jgi:enoyl-CoA hydratase/carnithine racemase
MSANGTDAAPLNFREDDGVFVIEVGSRPVNALSPTLLAALNEAFDACVETGARALVIASAVDGFYAAGADIKTIVDADLESFAAYGRDLRGTVERIPALGLPSIAAVEGRALGGGAELAMACTLRVGSQACSFGLPEVKIGLVPSAGATQRLPRLVGRGRALELMLSGREIDAAEAAAVGLLDRTVAAGAALEKALDLAGQLSAFSRDAIAAVIEGVDDSYVLPLAAGLSREAARMDELFCGHDAHEGLRAFVEKRPPKFGATENDVGRQGARDGN